MTQTVSGFTVPAGSDPVSSIDDTLVTFAGEVRAAITAATELPSQTGNSGKYLTTNGSAASWATVTAPTPSALVYVGGTSFSGVSAQSFNNVFTSTYENYQIEFSFDKSSTTGAVAFNFRSGGTDNTSGSYYSACNYVGITTAGSGITKRSAFSFIEFNDAGQLYNTVWIFKPQATAKTFLSGAKSAFTYGTDFYQGDISGLFNATTSFDGFTVSVGTGTMTGTIRVYGIANS